MQMGIPKIRLFKQLDIMLSQTFHQQISEPSCMRLNARVLKQQQLSDFSLKAKGSRLSLG